MNITATIRAAAASILMGIAGAMGAQAQERVPIVFIPGIGGSLLADRAAPQKTIFGNVKQSMDQFAKLELPGNHGKNRLVATDILREAQRARGTEVDQYNLLMDRFAALGYREGVDLFPFAYDWRFSNFETVERLRQFLAQRNLAGRPIDIVGHSMGGLIATIYIQKYAAEQRVRNFVAMGTPFFGAVKAIRALAEGFAVFGIENYLVVSAGSEGTVYRVFASMDSIYELLPTYHDCCYTRVSATAPMQPFTLATSDVAWDRFGLFLKEKSGAPANRAYLARMRANLVELRRLIDLPYPPNVRVVAVVSEAAENTPIQFLGAKRGIGKPVWGIGKFAGDGTVAKVSALGHINPANVIWSRREHGLIFEDDQIWPRLAALFRG